MMLEEGSLLSSGWRRAAWFGEYFSDFFRGYIIRIWVGYTLLKRMKKAFGFFMSGWGGSGRLPVIFHISI